MNAPATDTKHAYISIAIHASNNINKLKYILKCIWNKMISQT